MVMRRGNSIPSYPKLHRTGHHNFSEFSCTSGTGLVPRLRAEAQQRLWWARLHEVSEHQPALSHGVVKSVPQGLKAKSNLTKVL